MTAAVHHPAECLQRKIARESARARLGREALVQQLQANSTSRLAKQPKPSSPQNVTLCHRDAGLGQPLLPSALSHPLPGARAPRTHPCPLSEASGESWGRAKQSQGYSIPAAAPSPAGYWHLPALMLQQRRLADLRYSPGSPSCSAHGC